MEDRILGLADKREDVIHGPKKMLNLKRSLPKHPGGLGQYKKTKPKNNRSIIRKILLV